MQLSLFSGTLLFLLSVFNYPDDNSKKALITAAVNYELKLHPKAALTDIYKNFFQGKFGPAHLIDDPKSAMDYLAEELYSSTKFDTVLWQPVGYDNRYIRVNLSLIKDGTIPAKKLSDVFFKSANNSKPPAIKSWIKEWHYILQVIEGMNLPITGYKKDKKMLEEMLEKGETVIHHSDLFIELYNPHYRVISTEFIDELKTE
jgi:hypothetical protein